MSIPSQINFIPLITHCGLNYIQCNSTEILKRVVGQINPSLKIIRITINLGASSWINLVITKNKANHLTLNPPTALYAAYRIYRETYRRNMHNGGITFTAWDGITIFDQNQTLMLTGIHTPANIAHDCMSVLSWEINS